MDQSADILNKSDANIGLKIKGDLGDIQIIEEEGDSDDDNESNSDDDEKDNRTVGSLSAIPANLMNRSPIPIFGSVQVTGSENVQFGNNTYFNGPVTIKQVVSNQLGVDNTSYCKTEVEDLPAQPNIHPKSDNNAIKSFQCQLWQKITFSAFAVVLLGGICGLVALIFTKNNQDDSRTTSFNDDSTNDTGLVAGFCIDNFYQMFIISIIFAMFIIISISLLTKEAFNRKSPIVKQRRKGTLVSNIKIKHKYAADPLLIAPDHLRIVSRTDWLAQPVENELNKIRQPVPWVIITHTATESCSTQSECVLRVRLIQMFHIESRKWNDIGYNFLVAGDGSAYYGRGWDYIGAHTLGYNKYSIGIAFTGTFNNEAPPKKQIEACQKLIKRGVELGKLAKDYKLLAHRQLASTLSPGDKLFDIIKEWPHFVHNTTDISSLLPHY